MTATIPDGPPIVAAVLDWYATNARGLPWRRPGVSPYAVLVSEVMLQQTPVSRMLPAYEAWLARWPTPATLAADSPGEAVRQWGRLGYPRRALRLHEAATVVVERHGGELPESYDALRALPGVGDYTAAAVASFAFGQRHAVLDTNVRRVLARVIGGDERPGPSLTAAERRTAAAVLPADAPRAARWAVASMELGALVCKARAPRCADCPITSHCAWRLAGRPAHTGPPRRGQSYAGTDRQARGRLLAVLRDAAHPVTEEALREAWTDQMQVARALDGLVADGLVEPLAGGTYRLPATSKRPR
jgi:A/G-specific adenine glycosylase